MNNWELMVQSILELVSTRAIDPKLAETWLTTLVDRADAEGMENYTQ